MNRAFQVSGFLVLAGLTLYLFALATQQAWLSDPVSGLLVTVILVGLAYEVLIEGFKALPQIRWVQLMTRTSLFNFLSVFLGALATYSLSLGLGPVVAAGLVGIMAALLFPKYSVPIYCGAFVGMSSSAFFVTHLQLALGGLLAGLVYVAATGVLNGFGGKLGTIAFAGTVIAGISLGCSFSTAPLPAWDIRLIIIGYSVLACVSTYGISTYLKHSPVMASGIVGLTGGLLLPLIHPSFGGLLAVLVICASFAGMSHIQRFPRLSPLFVAGAFTGLIFIYTLACLGGPGGKLGTIGFGSVIALRGYLDLWEEWRRNKTVFSEMKNNFYSLFGSEKKQFQEEKNKREYMKA